MRVKNNVINDLNGEEIGEIIFMKKYFKKQIEKKYLE